jgi:26S proteasome regulatory subunit N3
MTPENRTIFNNDNTYSLIIRLRHNVIKTGLRKINLSYSCISIADICSKLQLENKEDAEYIVAKAIHDGVIDAVLDRKTHSLRSKPYSDVYATQEPAIEYHKRIEFCMQMHNEAVKAMSFPPNAHKTQAEMDAESLRQKEDNDEAAVDPDADDDYF